MNGNRLQGKFLLCCPCGEEVQVEFRNGKPLHEPVGWNVFDGHVHAWGCEPMTIVTMEDTDAPR